MLYLIKNKISKLGTFSWLIILYITGITMIMSLHYAASIFFKALVFAGENLI